MMRKISWIFLVCACLSSFACITPSEAALTLSVRPSEGGRDLRFGNISGSDPVTNKEMILTVTADTGTQYQVVQTLLDPLTNSEGVAISPQNFFATGIVGSNMSGTLRLTQETPVGVSRTIVYTSGPGGLADSFRLVFGLRAPLPPGSYRGRIAFTIEPINAPGNPDTIILNVFADIASVASIEIRPVQGTQTLRLTKGGERPFTAVCAVDIRGIMGRQFRLSSVLAKPFESADGTVLPEGAIKFSLESVKGRGASGQQMPLTQGQQAIYTSSPQGDPESFLIAYSLNAPERLAAGAYRSRITFIGEGLVSGQMRIASFDFEVEIPRIFDLIVKALEGGIITFRAGPNAREPQINEVVLEIRSNIGKQYLVSQKLTSELINREGKAIPEKFFTMRQERLSTKGTLKFPQSAAVQSAETVVFVSDRLGSPDTFKILYELHPSADVPAGDYDTSVIYSISEI